MSEKFRNKYTIKSTRLEKYNYSQNGMYFVTICTKDREEFFGSVIGEKMVLSDIGKIAKQYWQEIPQHFPFVNLDEYIVMPNHLHVIVEIIKNANTRNCRDEAMPRLKNHHYQDEALPRLYTGKYLQMSKISPKSDSLSVIIGSFKSIVAKTANKQFPRIGFAWQSRFYDHIIRNEKSLNKIREYIQTNPKMWERDRNLPAGEAGNLGDVFM
jgi:REP element-mobilizing transposase RayT